MRFVLQGKLGEGAMGVVYKALDTATGETVAVKVLSFRNTALEELRIARKISHPYVCRYFDFHQEGGKLFISMELLEGETLRRYLDRVGRIDVEEALRIFGQIMEGLAEAHRLKILHRDLKPENMMLVPDGDSLNVKLLDFGVAHFIDPTGKLNSRIRGSASHLAPEVLLNGPASVRSDIYSIGLILYEMVNGRPAFQGDSAIEVITKQVMEAPPAVSASVDLPGPIGLAILRCLAKNPEQRFASVAELRDALILSGGTAVATPAPFHALRVVSSLLILTTLLVFAALSEKAAVPPPAIPTPTPTPAPVLPKTLDGQMQSIAIFPFKNMVGDPKYQSFETRMAEDLRGAFSRSGRFRVVERSRIDEVIGSLKSPEQVGTKELGRLVGAQYLAFGSFQVFQGELTIFTDIDITATGEGVFSHTLTGEAKDATALSTRFANDLIAKLKDLKK